MNFWTQNDLIIQTNELVKNTIMALEQGRIKLFGAPLLALQPPLGVVSYSPLAGFSLLAYEVS